MPNLSTSGSGSEKLILLNFRDAPLDQILQFYSELTGRTMIKSPGINATITLRGQTRLTVDECMVAIDAVLAMNNVALVPMGEKFFKVVQPTAVRQEGFPIDRSVPEDGFEDTDELISQIITLRHLEVSEIQPVVQSFIHGYGKIQPLERANSLLITDTSANLQRIAEIIEIIDQPVEIKDEMRIYNILNVEASEIAGKLNELIAESQQEGQQQQQGRVQIPQQASPPGIIRPRRPIQPTVPTTPGVQTAADLAERGIIRGEVKIIADDRTGILFIISRPENFLFFDRIIKVLDVSVEAEIIVRVEPLEYADAEEIAGILNEFIGAAAAESTTAAGGAEGGEEGAGQGESPRSTALRDFVRQRAEQRTREAAAALGDQASRIGRLDPNTRILADKRTNSLLLMGRKSDIIAVQNMIDQLDIMLAQVLIETVIMEIDLRNDLEQGIDWLQRAFTVVNEEKVGPGGGLSVNQPVYSFGGGQRVLGSDLDFLDASGVTRDVGNSSLGTALTYYMTFYDLNLDAVIQMAAGDSDARILSTPVVMTTDNTTAKISVGEERPIVTTTSTTDSGTIRSSFEYRNIGINLTVTPRVNPERFVVMEITQTADDVGGTVLIDGNEVPIITKREFEAFIGVDSRETIVLGGLVRTDRRKTRSKIPLIGDIPILGALFRADTRDDARTELMVMITPYVVLTPQEALQETRRLYDSSQLPESKWERGWSDSKLTVEPKDRGRFSGQEKKETWTKQEERPSYTEIDDPNDLVPLGNDPEAGNEEAGSQKKRATWTLAPTPRPGGMTEEGTVPSAAPSEPEPTETADPDVLEEPVPR